MSDEEMRKAFEAFVRERNIGGLFSSLDRVSDGAYDNAHVRTAWRAWQAATRAAVPEWQPIEAAPRNGCLCLLCTDGGIVFVGKLNKHLQLWVDDEGRERFRTVKYWMPLPVPKEPT